MQTKTWTMEEIENARYKQPASVNAEDIKLGGEFLLSSSPASRAPNQKGLGCVEMKVIGLVSGSLSLGYNGGTAEMAVSDFCTKANAAINSGFAFFQLGEGEPLSVKAIFVKS